MHCCLPKPSQQSENNDSLLNFTIHCEPVFGEDPMNYLEPFDDPCFEWSERALVLEASSLEIEDKQVPGIYIYMSKYSHGCFQK